MATVGNALVAPFLACEVGDRQGVFGDVGAYVVVTETTVVKSFLTGVRQSQ